MQILSTDQRAALLRSLENASDDILLSAVNEMKTYRKTVEKDFDDLRAYVGMKDASNEFKPFGKPTVSPLNAIHPPILTATAQSVDIDPNLTLPNIEPAKPNVAPEHEPSAKVGGETKEKILSYCSIIPRTLVQINTFLERGKGRLGDTGSLMRRLWDQDVVWFDGETYGKR